MSASCTIRATRCCRRVAREGGWWMWFIVMTMGFIGICHDLLWFVVNYGDLLGDLWWFHYLVIYMVIDSDSWWFVVVTLDSHVLQQDFRGGRLTWKIWPTRTSQWQVILQQRSAQRSLLRRVKNSCESKRRKWRRKKRCCVWTGNFHWGFSVKNLWIQHDLCGFTSRLLGEISILAPGVHHGEIFDA